MAQDAQEKLPVLSYWYLDRTLLYQGPAGENWDDRTEILVVEDGVVVAAFTICTSRPIVPDELPPTGEGTSIYSLMRAHALDAIEFEETNDHKGPLYTSALFEMKPSELLKLLVTECPGRWASNATLILNRLRHDRDRYGSMEITAKGKLHELFRH